MSVYGYESVGYNKICYILVASKCQCMGMRVLGITRSVPSEKNRCPAVSEYR